MEVWQLTDGLMAEMDLGRVGMTWMWFSETSEHSAVIEWNSLLNTVQVSVVLGGFASLAGWQPLNFTLQRSAMVEHIRTALRTWQRQHTPVPSALTMSMQRGLSVRMMTDLLDAVEMDSEA